MSMDSLINCNSTNKNFCVMWIVNDNLSVIYQLAIFDDFQEAKKFYQIKTEESNVVYCVMKTGIKKIKSGVIRGYRANNIPTVEFELTLEQVKEINEICKPFVVDKKEGD